MNYTLIQQHIENLITRPVARYKWAVYVWDFILLPCIGVGLFFVFFSTKFSFFLVLAFYILMIFTTLASYSNVKAGLFLPKNLFIDPKLKQDIEQAIYLKDQGIITAIEKPKSWFTGSLYRVEICSHHTQQKQYYEVYLNRVITNTNETQQLRLVLNEDCIGQAVEFSYLPQSKQILQIFAQDNSDALHYMDVVIPPKGFQMNFKVQAFPTKLVHELKKAKQIFAIRDDALDGNFQIVIKTFSNQSYIIPSNTPHFDQFEKILNKYLRMSTNYLNFKRHSEQKDLVIFEDKWGKRLSQPYIKWLTYIAYGILTIVAILSFPKILDLSNNLTFFSILILFAIVSLINKWIDNYKNKHQALL